MNPRDAVEAVIGAFADANLVALGERHWAREDSEFRLKLLRHPAFVEAAPVIVVEFAGALHQDLLDRFVAGDDVPPAELPNLWRDTTQPGAWDSPVYEEFFHAVRLANAGLPPARRLRVLAADPPLDWTRPAGDAAIRESLDGRDRFAASLIEREVLRRGRQALLLFGALHLCRERPGTVAELLRDYANARCFSVIPVDEAAVAGLLAAEPASPAEPLLVSLANSPVGALPANELLGKGNQRVKLVDGKMVLVPAPLFAEGLPVRQVADACLYFGGAPPELVPPPVKIYRGPWPKFVTRP